MFLLQQVSLHTGKFIFEGYNCQHLALEILASMPDWSCWTRKQDRLLFMEELAPEKEPQVITIVKKVSTLCAKIGSDSHTELLSFTYCFLYLLGSAFEK